MALILAIMLFALFWGADRGFNFTDEGYYLIYYQHPERYRISLNSVPFLMGKLYAVVHGDIYWLRVARIALLAAGTAFFSTGFLRFLQPRTGQSKAEAEAAEQGFMSGVPLQICLLLFLFIGGLSACLLGPQTISYNHLTQFLLLMLSGVLLRLHSAPKPGQPVPRYAYFTAIGAITGLHFLVKWPVSVLVLATGLISMGVERARTTFSIPKCLGFLGLGVVASLIAYFLFFQPWPEWLDNFLYSYRIMTQRGLHDPHALLSNYLRELLEMFGHPFMQYGREMFSLIACALFAALLKRTGPRQINPARFSVRRVVKILLGFCALIATYVLVEKIHFNHGISGILTSIHVYLTILATLGLFAGMASILFPQHSPSEGESRFNAILPCWVGVLLLSLPFIGLFGTSNPIGYNAHYGLIFWFALLILLSRQALRNARSVMLPVLCGFLYSVFVLAQVGFYFYDSNRYLYPAFLPYHQTGMGEYAAVRNLKVDPMTYEFVTNVHTALTRAGFQPGDRLIPLYDLPGLVYLLGATSPGIAWYNSYPQAMGENCAGLAMTGPKKLRATYFLVNKPVDAVMEHCLQAQGVRLGESHRMVAQVPYPFAPFYNPGYYNEVLQVFAPAILQPSRQ